MACESGTPHVPKQEARDIAGPLRAGDPTTIRAVAEGKDPRTTRVREAMTEETISCFEDQDVQEAARTVQERQVRRLVVLNRDKRLVGIVSLGDLATESVDQEKAGEVLQDVSEPALPRR
jgi:predicted transcriptional regulator